MNKKILLLQQETQERAEKLQVREDIILQLQEEQQRSDEKIEEMTRNNSSLNEELKLLKTTSQN